MEHVSTVLSRTMAALPPPVEGSVLADRIRAFPTTLGDLTRLFAAEESLENPDTVTAISSLRMTPAGTLEVPGEGRFSFTDWSRRQCATLVGLRWDRWFENCSAEDRADELNRRFTRAQGTIRLRTARSRQVEPGTDGVLRAMVSPGYSAIADSEVAGLVETVLSPFDSELKIIRSDMTERSTSYVVAVGKPYRIGGPGEVGDVWGGLLIRNSGVGFASLMMTLHLTRLLCRNGMVAPLIDAVVLRRRHRGFDAGKLRGVLAERLRGLPGRLREGADLLLRSRERRIDATPEVVIRRVLDQANLPQRLTPAIVEAYAEEPDPTAFGISQAMTLAAQRLTPEDRLDLERAASQYLAN